MTEDREQKTERTGLRRRAARATQYLSPLAPPGRGDGGEGLSQASRLSPLTLILSPLVGEGRIKD